MDINLSLPTNALSNIVNGIVYIFYILFIVGGIYLVFKWMQYKIPVELYAQEGKALIKIKDTRAKENSSTKGSEYELRDNMFKPGTKKEYFRINDSKFRIPSRKGVIYKLVRMGFNDYQPIAIEDSKKLEVISQNNTGWLANKIKQIHSKYADKSWWNHPLVPIMAIMIISIIHFILIAMILDKAGQIGGVCQQASDNIVSKVSQAIK